MEKSIHSSDARVFLALLREFRERAGVTQVELAASLARTQSFVSKVERGETRVDVLQLRHICHAIGVSLPDFVAALEERLPRRRKAKSETRGT